MTGGSRPPPGSHNGGVLPGNHRARRFYEVAGWEDDGARRTSEVLGVVVPEVRYRRRLQQPG
jgi:RimJ/RimL family protein N-acetyltransferase